MSKSNTFENDLLKLVFQGTAIANLADNAGTSPLTNLYFALHTADPGEAGSAQTTSEVSYSGYARQAVARSDSGFTVSGNTVSLVAAVEFAVPPGTGSNCTYASIGTAASGSGKILYRLALSPEIVIAAGVTPRITSLTLTED